MSGLIEEHARATTCRVFSSMGVAVEVILVGSRADANDAAATVEAEFRRLDAIFSRFREDSELTALNRDGHIDASPELLEVTARALEARADTNGSFDPTVHDALVAAGYDRTFDALPAERIDSAGPVPRCGGAVEVSLAAGTIDLEPGVRLDLGGIAKGYAVDRACNLLADAGSCLVNAGGDLAVRGSLDGRPWPIGVLTPAGTITLELPYGGMATSGRDLRRWRRNGAEAHHLIDPATGLPATTDVLRVTTVSHSAVAAEIEAKRLFLAGYAGGVQEADVRRIPSVFVGGGDRWTLAGGLS